MTDRIALFLGLFLVLLCVLDLAANGGGVLFFLARKFTDFVEYLAFWR